MRRPDPGRPTEGGRGARGGKSPSVLTNPRISRVWGPGGPELHPPHPSHLGHSLDGPFDARRRPSPAGAERPGDSRRPYNQSRYRKKLTIATSTMSIVPMIAQKAP